MDRADARRLYVDGYLRDADGDAATGRRASSRPTPPTPACCSTPTSLLKALYEVRYELANRPAWVSWPLAAVAQMLAR